jgi:hypothetical protein
MGNEGAGGLQTTDVPSAGPGVMAIGSVDSSYTLQTIIIAPDGSQIFYTAGSYYGPWTSVFNSTIVINSRFSLCLLNRITFE